MDHIGFLGNDAVHADMRNFDHVDQETVGVALVVVIHILQALYQFKSVVTSLNALRKPSALAKK